MDPETQELVNKQFKKLPSNLQKALETMPWKASIKEIAVVNKVPIEKVEIVERETMFILYGFESPADYIANLMREVGIDEATATNIANATAEKIFKPISDKATEFEAQGKPAQPVVITKEIKQEMMQNLAQRVEAARQGGASVKPHLPELAPEIHPMVEPGETAHTVEPLTRSQPPTTDNIQKTDDPPQTTDDKTQITKSATSYESGKDPYREPLL